MLSEDAFQSIDDGTGRSVSKLPDHWKLAAFVGYQEVLVSSQLNQV